MMVIIEGEVYRFCFDRARLTKLMILSGVWPTECNCWKRVNGSISDLNGSDGFIQSFATALSSLHDTFQPPRIWHGGYPNW